MNENRETQQTDDPAPLDFTTGDDSRRPAKFGQERRGGDADWATEAQRLNNLPAQAELLEGRCSIDGLPEGNCVHFPGPQTVSVPGYPGAYSTEGDLGEDGLPTDEAMARNREHSRPEHGAAARGARSGDQPDGSVSANPVGHPDSDDQKAAAEKRAREDARQANRDSRAHLKKDSSDR
jgi:hypothetical protein